MDGLVVQGEIGSRIFMLRGKEVMLDRDLAELYQVETKVLNQAVKRNIKRFPSDFMFQLRQEEKNELVTNCDRFNRLKHSTAMPYVFTEQGVYMLATVLKSDVAIEVNIAIMRTFAKLRESANTTMPWHGRSWKLNASRTSSTGSLKRNWMRCWRVLKMWRGG